MNGGRPRELRVVVAASAVLLIALFVLVSLLRGLG
jgi:hypothetical protein